LAKIKKRIKMVEKINGWASAHRNKRDASHQIKKKRKTNYNTKNHILHIKDKVKISLIVAILY